MWYGLGVTVPPASDLGVERAFYVGWVGLRSDVRNTLVMRRHLRRQVVQLLLNIREQRGSILLPIHRNA